MQVFELCLGCSRQAKTAWSRVYRLSTVTQTLHCALSTGTANPLLFFGGKRQLEVRVELARK